MNETIKRLFGEDALSYAEFERRAGDAKLMLGDLAEAESRYKRELDEVRISHALEKNLELAGAKNSTLVKRALNMDEVTVENGVVKGLSEQISALRQSDPYLFREREMARTGAEHGGISADPDGMSDAEYYRARLG